ncbi:MAG: GNAT family N-acetyltransferase, partial [Treponema sp.]|nr:GNAT family N-acetyltransferase [Treponema sp.]
RYELRYDEDFDLIVNRCLEIHGEAWLTPPLVDAIRSIRLADDAGQVPGLKKFCSVRPVSFALYRDGKLVAGEFGIITSRSDGQARVYTSYSGYYDEDNAGTVQLIKTTEYLRDNGFAFFDLGMPLDYKNDLGALNIGPDEFVTWFRRAIL